jgi:hypothetical protein
MASKPTTITPSKPSTKPPPAKTPATQNTTISSNNITNAENSTIN